MANNMDKLVDRFLCWKLPMGFSPDGGITFDRTYSGIDEQGRLQKKTIVYGDAWWPIGTNLFSADQARAMLEYVLQVEAPTTKSDPGKQFNSTYNDDREPAVICRDRSWIVGTRLEGTDCRGSIDVIEITRIDDNEIRAVQLTRNGINVPTFANMCWSLYGRDWHEVSNKPAPDPQQLNRADLVEQLKTLIGQIDPESVCISKRTLTKDEIAEKWKAINQSVLVLADAERMKELDTTPFGYWNEYEHNFVSRQERLDCYDDSEAKALDALYLRPTERDYLLAGRTVQIQLTTIKELEAKITEQAARIAELESVISFKDQQTYSHLSKLSAIYEQRDMLVEGINSSMCCHTPLSLSDLVAEIEKKMK